MMVDTFESNDALQGRREILECNPTGGPLFASMRVLIAEHARDFMRIYVNRNLHTLRVELVADPTG